MLKAKIIRISIVLCIASLSACSTSRTQLVYEGLLERARNKGYVQVLVGLDTDIPMAKLKKLSPTLRQELLEKEKELLDVLGDTVSKSGQWRSGLGQLRLYVTAEGLKRLTEWRHVKQVIRSTIDRMLVTYHDNTGTLVNDIEAEIEQNDFAEVEVVLNLKNLSYHYLPSGETDFDSSPAQEKELGSTLARFFDSLKSEHVLNLAHLKGLDLKESSSPVQHLKIDKEGLFALQENKSIRALRLVNAEKREPRLESDVLEVSKKQGEAGVIITLHQPFGYSPQMGRLPAKAWDTQVDMLAQTFKDIFASLGDDAVKSVQEFKGIPGIYAVLSHEALQTLYKDPDARIGRVRLNKGAYGSLLNKSTAFIQMDNAWDHNPPYRGAGQQIVVMDSAFDKSHPFLALPNGSSKVVFEACFGTTGSVLHPSSGVVERYVSLCPSADPVTGDSPLNLFNSVDSSICSGDPSLVNLCNHGTYVAGIAAGKYRWTTQHPNSPGNNITLTRMAPDASIVGVSIMSKQIAGDPSLTFPRLWGTYLDIDQAITTVANETELNSAITVSLSVGDREIQGADCPFEDDIFNWAASILYSNNIPIVAATGNLGLRTKILWPACTPHVIKVAGTVLSNNTESFWAGSNIVNPSQANGPILLAPACVISSGIGGGASGGQGGIYCGTSAATPHVAGLYALIKQADPTITVDAATAWILTQGSVPVSTGQGYTVPSIRIPQL
jgi:subtilisin family serine protease